MINIRTKDILKAKEKVIVVNANLQSIEDSKINNLIIEHYPHINRECLHLINSANEDLVGNVKFVDCQNHIAAVLFTHRHPDERTNTYAYMKCIDYLFNYCAKNNLSVAIPYRFWSNNTKEGELHGWNKILTIATRKMQELYNVDVSFYR